MRHTARQTTRRVHIYIYSPVYEAGGASAGKIPGAKDAASPTLCVRVSVCIYYVRTHVRDIRPSVRPSVRV